MSEELKRCPFCGGEAVLHVENSEKHYCQVRCTYCGVSTRAHLDYLTDIAVYEWNRRSYEPPIGICGECKHKTVTSCKGKDVNEHCAYFENRRADEKEG